MNSTISISGIGSISPLGSNLNDVTSSYNDSNHYLKECEFEGFAALCAEIKAESKKEINAVQNSNKQYKNLDKSVLLAIYAARECLRMSGWDGSDSFGVNIGSSRGATTLYENYHKEFLETKQCSNLTSPTTTLGNISSWVSDDLQNNGPVISHSITCSTALHAVLNGVAWLKCGMATKFIVGGSEAPLTAFTLAQMKALRLYAKNEGSFPCRSLDFSKKSNSMVLGEGASVACLELGVTKKTLAIIDEIGYATEILKHGVSISTNADCFQRSMKMALRNSEPSEVDVVIMHSPGTVKGDQAEWNAIKATFEDSLPIITSNKWKIGHTLAASGMLSVEMAICMIKSGELISNPFLGEQRIPNKINKILVNAVGFGGNAVSILLSSPHIYS